MLTYEKSGVSRLKDQKLSEKLSKVIGELNIKSFAPVFKSEIFKDHFLVSTCDGIGTKIIPLTKFKDYKTMALDLAAMNLNDLAATGAKPLFFLDYIAHSNLDVDFVSDFIYEFQNILLKYNCTLLGGETSQLSDMILENNFDACAFAIGVVNREEYNKREEVQSGDIVIALKSNGVHSNGFTLIRKLYEENLITEEIFMETLKPTTIYISEILELYEKRLIKTVANITGGGIVENLARVIPENLGLYIKKEKIENENMPYIFNVIKNIVGEIEAYKTFNMGVGMCVITNEENIDNVLNICNIYDPFVLGKINENNKNINISIA